MSSTQRQNLKETNSSGRFVPNLQSSTPPRTTTSSPSSSNPILSDTYKDQVSLMGHGNKEIDTKSLSKHLVPQEDTLKLQGGDVARTMYQQLDNVAPGTFDKRRTRSSSFSTFLSESRRGSTASDINVPGGFRREFLVNKSLQENSKPPNFLTANFVEFLSIYGHFAGEDLSDDDESSMYDDEDDAIVDEESSLMGSRRYSSTQYVHPPPPPPNRSRQKSHKKGGEQGKTSVAKTYFLVFKALVGSGVLFLPRAFYNGGLLFSILALSLFGFLTFICYIILVQARHTLKLSSFGELGFKTYGEPLKYSILFSIILSQIGFVATYILFTAENLISFCENFLQWDSVYITTGNIVVVQCILLIPLVLIRKISKLSLISLISSAFIVIGLIIIFYYSGLQLFERGLGPNITQFNSSSWSMLIGVAVTSFEGIGLILPIEAAMAEPEKFPQVLSICMIIITTLFVSVGTIGYTAFGDQVKSIIILNLPQSSTAVQFIQILYSLAVFLTAPLQIFPVTRIVESNIFNSRLFTHGNKNKDKDGRLYRASGKYNSNVKWLKNLVRALMIVAISTVAYFNSKNIDKFISFNGCFACIPLVYIYPPLIHLKTYANNTQITLKGKILKIMDYFLIVTGIIIVIYTTYQILFLN